MSAHPTSHLLQRPQQLPPPLTRDLIIERDLKTPMRDGAVLLGDRPLDSEVRHRRRGAGRGGHLCAVPGGSR